MEDAIKTVDYLGLQCMVITRNAINYYNVSNWGKQTNKLRRDYNHWIRLNNSQSTIKACKEESGLDEVILDKTNLRKEHRGMYVHDNLAVLIAIWIDIEFGIRVARLVNEGIKRELHLKYGNIIKAKDDKIDELSRKIDEMMRDTKQVLSDNKITHSKLEETHSKLDKVELELKETHTELVETRSDREEIEHKLDVVTDLIDGLSVNTVPSDRWNKFAVYKLADDNNEYRAVRCLRSAFERHRKRSIPPNAKCLYETELPNGVEYFATFKEEYARNRRDKSKNAVTISYNNIKLNVSEDEFVKILHQHRKRIDEMIEEGKL